MMDERRFRLRWERMEVQKGGSMDQCKVSGCTEEAVPECVLRFQMVDTETVVYDDDTRLHEATVCRYHKGGQ